MSIYRFVFRNPGGKVEELGFIPLPSDKDAIAFGTTVIRDMVEGSLLPQTGAVMEVTDDGRTVGSIQPDQSN